VANYLAEIHRVLKPGGRCLITWFVLNAETQQLIERGQSTIDLRHPLEGCTTSNPSEPDVALGYAEDRVLAFYKQAGLALETPINFGKWCGRQSGLTFQDICVAQRPRD
jgi:hypothetical protein